MPGPAKPEVDHPTEVGRFYDAHHDAFSRVYGEVVQAFRTHDLTKLLDHQAAQMELRSGMRLLDAGCGVAGPAAHFARSFDVQIDAVNVSRTQLSRARERLSAEGLEDRVHLFELDYHRLDEHFPADCFDVVYFLESFGHAHDKQRVLSACARVLRPGGLLFVKDLFVREPPFESLRAAISREVARINEAYRYHIAELPDVLRMLEPAGLELASLRTIDIPLEDFENLTISNEFQELTGVARIEDWSTYVFPVDFFELKALATQDSTSPPEATGA